MTSTKYIINGSFNTLGYIDKQDLIGSFFGQTEGLIGDELEFQNLQKTGKLGRIDITLIKSNGKTKGKFQIPTSLNKVEVSLVAATLESITKIGATTGEIKILSIIDKREDKRKLILKRAEELLSNLKEVLPNSIEITENITQNFSKHQIKTYGKNIFGGKDIKLLNEIIIVEGRADVLNLLKNGINNVISFNREEINNSIYKLCSQKELIAFLDGDKPGKFKLEELKDLLNIDYYSFAPEGKEVEELNYKEIIKCLKNKIEIEKPISNDNILINKIKDIIIKKLNKKEELIIKPIKNIKKNKNIVDFKNNYFNKQEYNKIKNIIEGIKDKNEYILLNENNRIIKKGKIKDIYNLQTNKGKTLVFDGICENLLINKAKENNIEIIISKSKSRCKESIKIFLFDFFIF